VSVRHPLAPSSIASSVSRPLAALDDATCATFTNYVTQCAASTQDLVEIFESSEWGRSLLSDTPPQAGGDGKGGASSGVRGSGSRRGRGGVSCVASVLKGFGPSGNAEFATPSGFRAASSKKGSATDAPRVLFA
jgi:hypothetical protein